MTSATARPQIQTNTTQTPPDNPAALSQEYIHRAAWKAGVLGAVNVLAKVLAARILVLIAIMGGITLALTLGPADWLKVVVLAVYCAGVVLPAVVLAAWGR